MQHKTTNCLIIQGHYAVVLDVLQQSMFMCMEARCTKQYNQLMPFRYFNLFSLQKGKEYILQLLNFRKESGNFARYFQGSPL